MTKRYRFSRFICAGAMLFTAMSVSSVQAGAATAIWNNDGGNAGHSGYVDMKTDPAKFKVLWTRSFLTTKELDGLSFPNTMTTDHMLYMRVQTFSHLADPGINGIYALNSATGETVWSSISTDRDYFSSSPVFDNGKLYWYRPQTDNFDLIAVDAETGAPQLSKSIAYVNRSTELSDLVIADHHLYFGGKDGSQYSVSAETGETDWVVQAGDETNLPTIAGDYLVRVNYPDLDVVDRKTGNKSFIHITDNPKFVSATPVWDGKSKTLYAVEDSLQNSELIAVDLEQGIVKWRTTFKDTLDMPVAAGDVVYTSDYTTLYEVNAVTGKVNWSILLDKGFHNMLVTPDLVFVNASMEGKLRAISRRTHRVVWTSNKTGRLSTDGTRLFLLGSKGFTGVEMTAIALQ